MKKKEKEEEKEKGGKKEEEEEEPALPAVRLQTSGARAGGWSVLVLQATVSDPKRTEVPCTPGPWGRRALWDRAGH
jgi:hypothetical protein